MNQNFTRNWNVTLLECQGVECCQKMDSVRNKMLEANCDVVCFQETKKENFDNAFIRKVLPPAFDDFLFVPAVGASGGLLVAWICSRMRIG